MRVETPLHAAAARGDTEAVRKAIAEGADIDARYGDYTVIIGYAEGALPRNQTALILAARNGHLEVVKLLVDAGADLYVVQSNSRGDDHGNAFDVALREGRIEVARFLWERSDRKRFARQATSSAANAIDRSCLASTARRREEILHFALDAFGKRHLSEALGQVSSPRPCLPSIIFLLDHGVEPTGAALLRAAGLGVDELVARYVRQGVPVNELVPHHLFGPQTALMMAAAAWQVPSMRLLLDHGADPNVQDRWGRTALMRILERGGCRTVNRDCDRQIEAMELLLARGARADHKDAQGKTALDHAGRFPDEHYGARKRSLLGGGP